MSEAAVVSSEELSAAWQEYVTTVSTPRMAISLELAKWLYWETRARQSVLDLGSGFSTFVFASAGCKVESWDREATWLEKTADFLGMKGLHADYWVQTPGRRLEKLEGSWDLVFFDLGHIAWRCNPRRVEWVLGLAGEAPVVFDDMQGLRGRYGELVRKEAELWGRQFVPLESTRDCYRRWAAVVK